MKKIFNIILLLWLPVLVWAQSQQDELDRRYLALKNAANDTIRLDISFNLALFYNEINFDSALFYLGQSLPIAQKLNLKLIEAHILENRGFILTRMGNYSEALESYLLALKIAEDPSSEKITWGLQSGRTPRTERLSTLGYTYYTMGHLYGTTGNTDKQISNYRLTVNLANSIQDTSLYIGASNSLVNVYLNLHKIDSALLIQQRVIDLTKERGIGRSKYDGLYFINLGTIYLEKGDFNLAKDAFQVAIHASKLQNNLSSLGRAHSSLSRLYQSLKMSDSSLFYAKKALDIFKNAGLTEGIKFTYQLLSDIYNDLKNKDSAFAYLKLYTALNDSLNEIVKDNLMAYQNLGFEKQMRLKSLENEKIQTQARTRINTMLAGLAVFLIIGLILYRNNRQKQKANKVLEKTLSNLKSTQSQLIQSEKMASLGELAAGIAHEIQNPLNFVNNFSEVNKELLDELNEEADNGNLNGVKTIAKNLTVNEEKIILHGKRADAIVKSMLQHTRISSGQKEPTDINALCDKYLKLAHHGLLAKDKSFNAEIKTDFDSTIGKINVLPQDIARAVVNLLNNAFYAVNEKAKQNIAGYEPVVSVSTKKVNDKVEISVKDNGNGIPDSIKEKIFQPFFTTKPTGSGTGLGLSLSYDIVKAHGGEITMKSKEDEGTEFIIMLPNT